MKITVTVELDGKDPVAEMIRLFGAPLVQQAAVEVKPSPIAEKIAEIRADVREATKLKDVIAGREPRRGRPAGSKNKANPPAPVAASQADTPQADEQLPHLPPMIPPADEPATPAVPAAPVTPATKEEAAQALNSVFEQKGMEAATALLSRFGVNSFKHLLEKSYGDFVAEAKKVLA